MRRYQNQRDPIAHQIDLETMREMEEMIPMNLYERKSLHNWVLDYIHAYRRHHEYEYKIIYKITEE